MLLDVLKKVGFSEKEAVVYLTGLQVGAQPASVIAKKAGINRSTTYLVLDELRKKGLASQVTKADIKYFTVVSPEKLISYLNALENNLKRTKKEIEDSLPSFLNLINPVVGKPRVLFFEGIQGIKSVYEDTLSNPEVKEILSFWAVDKVPSEVREYLDKDYIPKRVKMNIKGGTIAPDSPMAREMRTQDKKQKRKKMVLVDRKKYGFDLEINIYGDKVAFMSYEKDMIGLIIQSPVVADAMRKIHNFCYDRGLNTSINLED